MDIKQYARKIEELANEVETYRNYKKSVANALTSLEIKYKNKAISLDEYRKAVNRYLRGRNKQEVIKEYDEHVQKLLEGIRNVNSQIYRMFSNIEAERLDRVKVPIAVPQPGKTVKAGSILDKRRRLQYLDDLQISQRDVKEFIQKQKGREIKIIEGEREYTVYTESKIGKLANILCGRFTNWFTRKYPDLFKKLYDSLRVSDTRILSKTYVSITILSSIIAFLIFSIAAYFFFTGSIWFNIVRAISIGFLAGIIAFLLIYFYPITVIKSRSRRMKDELPFVAIHMAAVAGSGARPITIFKLVLDSKEYKVISVEIKKIMNYVNLFGYNLSTALKAVAATTPSYDFRELLNGMVASIETGGDLKTYLKGKADELLNTYRLERRKYVDTLAAYSDIYTGVLIAAPLLFIVTLAIINVIGGEIAGLSADVIARLGTYGLIPFLNIAFLLFLNIVQPKD